MVAASFFNDVSLFRVVIKNVTIDVGVRPFKSKVVEQRVKIKGHRPTLEFADSRVCDYVWGFAVEPHIFSPQYVGLGPLVLISIWHSKYSSEQV